MLAMSHPRKLVSVLYKKRKFAHNQPDKERPFQKLKSTLRGSWPTVNSKREDGNRVLVIEDGGQPIHVGLKTRDPLRPKGCIFYDETCPVLQGTDCDRTDVIYKIECMTCMEAMEDGEEVHN